MVPIQLDAMVLREDTAGFADCRMREPDPAGPQRQQLLPPPFADLGSVRPCGAYLHWALPDALTHERPAADGGSVVPAIPDRWLVTRLSQGTMPTSRRATSWVIEASGDQPQVTPLEDWTESGRLPTPGREPTVYGHGDIAWAAYYDNVVNRLGFFDPLDDGVVGPIAYLVCGWYADPRLDPLAGTATTSLSDFYARMADLGWSFPAGELEVDVLAVVPAAAGRDPRRPARDPGAGSDLARAAAAGGQPPLITDGSWWPTGLLCHGSVVAIGWPEVGFPAAEDGLLGVVPSGPPEPGQTRVAFGTTPTDALGALMVGFLAAAQGVPVDDVLSEDRMLEAFQLGLLAEIDHPDGRARLDARLHASAFHAADGGRRTEQLTAPKPPEPPIPPRGLDPAVPAAEPPALVTVQSAGGGLAADLGAPDPGGLEALLAQPAGTPAAASDPETVQRSLPRWFRAREPAVVLQGVNRSLKHGGDGRFTLDGTLMCRLGGFVVDVLSAIVGAGGERAAFTADDLLETPFDRRGAPAEVADLVREAVLLDPGSARAAALHVAPDPAEELVTAFMVEQTVWWGLRDPLVDAGTLLANSGLGGTLPSPIAVTPPAVAWAPRHLDWSVEVFPTPGGTAGWSLGEIDLSVDDAQIPTAAPGSGLVVSGRSVLAGGVANTAAAAGRQAIDIGTLAGTAGVAPGDSNVFVPASLITALAGLGGVDARGAEVPGPPTPATQTVAEALVAALRSMDVLAGSLDGLHAALRGEPAGQLVGTVDPPPPDPDADALGLLAGVFRPVRLRLVDCFGQVVDLLDSGPGQPADAAKASKARTVVVRGRPDLVAAPPRFTAPGRLVLRFVDADPGPTPTPLEETGEHARPVCGFVLPDHLDGALEFFDATGTPIGSVEPSPDGDGRAVWTNAPGTPSVAGRAPSAFLPDPQLGALADALVRWGATDAARGSEGALAALLRLVDSTLWTVDPFAHAGEEHLSLLVGHPVIVLRAVLRLDLDDPLQPRDALTTPVTVRLGALAAWQDGLLGFVVDGEPDTAHACAPAALALARETGPGQGYLGAIGQVPAFDAGFAGDLAPGGTPRSPITHPFVSPDPTVQLWPGHPVGLTLLVVPQATVNATAGVLPRKEVGVRRQWIADALTRMTPSFRFGPVLVDPATIRMPVAAELNGTWTWNHRSDVIAWVDDPVVNATGDAVVTSRRADADEGWLTLHPDPEARS
jgi:hypothetical protein